tara:strand:+ start:338 stop:832 length:495 start_codon:yes stop_codon:yes gene_type:complete
MLAVARRIGFGDAEAEDLVQITMTNFVEAYRRGQYRRERGRLSSYLITILRSRAIDLWRTKRRRRETDTPPEAIEHLSNRHVTRLWMDERQTQVLRQALDELRGNGVDENMIKAFEMFGVIGIEIAEVTETLGMTREEVYNAKYRITQRLRPIVAKLDEIYEDL